MSYYGSMVGSLGAFQLEVEGWYNLGMDDARLYFVLFGFLKKKKSILEMKAVECFV